MIDCKNNINVGLFLNLPTPPTPSEKKLPCLPPTSEGWGNVIVSVCPHLQGGGGTPSEVWMGVPYLRSRWGGDPYPSLDGRGNPIPGSDGWYPIPGLDEGVPHARSEWDVRHSADGGYPHPRSGCGVPPPPSTTGWGTHLFKSGWVPPPLPISKASTCYAVGGVPLAFTQDDFFVYLMCVNTWIHKKNVGLFWISQSSPPPPPPLLRKKLPCFNVCECLLWQ